MNNISWGSWIFPESLVLLIKLIKFTRGEAMKLLREMVVTDGKVYDNNVLKVDSFLHH